MVLRTLTVIALAALAWSPPLAPQVLRDGPPVLQPVPEPDLAQLAPEAQAILARARALFSRSAAAEDPRVRAAAWGRLGMVYQAQRLQAAAEAAYRNAIALDGDDPRWPYYLAAEYEEQGRLEDALALYGRSADLVPDRAHTWLRIGQVALELGRLSQSRSAYAHALELAPQLAPALAGLGDIAMRREEFDQAIAHFEAALADQPQANQLHYRLAQAYRNRGDLERARRHLAMSGQRAPYSGDRWIGVMETLAHSTVYYVRVGTTAIADGNPAAAIEAFRAATFVDPENLDALVGLAEALRLDGQSDAALQHVERALALAPDHAVAITIRGALLAAAGRQQEALVHLRGAVKANPHDITMREMLATQLMRSGDFDEAAEHYAVLTRLRPDEAALHYRHGLARLAADRCSEALEPLREATDLAPDAPEPAEALARAYATCPATTLAQRREARELAERLYRAGPDVSRAETLAMVMAAIGQYADAVDFQAQAIFEASKRGMTTALPRLRENMVRYQADRPAERAWPVDHPIFHPPR